jgi:hypothetical protein
MKSSNINIIHFQLVPRGKSDVVYLKYVSRKLRKTPSPATMIAFSTAVARLYSSHRIVEYRHCTNLQVIYDVNLLHQYDLRVYVLLNIIVNNRFVAAINGC